MAGNASVWFGTGLLCAGAVVTAGTCAAWLLLLPVPLYPSWWMLAGLAVLAVATASAVVSARADAREQSAKPPSPEASRRLGTATADAVRGGAWWVAGIAAALAVAGGFDSLVAMYGGVPFLPVTILTLGLVSTTAGALVVACSAPVREWPRSGGGFGGGAGGFWGVPPPCRWSPRSRGCCRWTRPPPKSVTARLRSRLR